MLTPSWCWHDHACVGDHPLIWQDVLDMHIINMLSGSFREETELMTEWRDAGDCEGLDFIG